MRTSWGDAMIMIVVVMIIYYRARRAIIMNFMICGRAWGAFREGKNVKFMAFCHFLHSAADHKDIYELLIMMHNDDVVLSKKILVWLLLDRNVQII
jgi:hypothetical protein